MVDKKSIGISTLIAIVLITASVVGPTFFETPKYYCESESSIMECPGGLSGGRGTRCYLNTEKNSWDYCSSGWAEITDDRAIQEEPKEIPVPADGIKWLCSYEGCERIE